MGLLDGIIGPIAGLLDKLIPDPKARDEAKLKLIELQGGQEMEATKVQRRRKAPTRGPAAHGRASST